MARNLYRMPFKKKLIISSRVKEILFLVWMLFWVSSLFVAAVDDGGGGAGPGRYFNTLGGC